MLLLIGAVLLLLVRLALLALPFRVVTRMLRPSTHRTHTPRHSPERIDWAVRLAARLLPGESPCLARALTTQALLNRFGHPARVRIGVARDTTRRFYAHAWVEGVDGLPLGERSLEGFTALPALDRHQP